MCPRIEVWVGMLGDRFFVVSFFLRKVETSKHAGSPWVLPDFMFLTCLEVLVIILPPK